MKNGGVGVLHLYGNYQGDMLNFDTAAEIAEDGGIPVQTCIARDDVAVVSSQRRPSIRAAPA